MSTNRYVNAMWTTTATPTASTSAPSEREHADALGADPDRHEGEHADDPVLQHAADDHEHRLGSDLERPEHAVDAAREFRFLRPDVGERDTEHDRKKTVASRFPSAIAATGLFGTIPRTTSVSDGGACDCASPPVNSTPRPGRSRFATASPISPANVVVTA